MIRLLTLLLSIVTLSAAAQQSTTTTQVVDIQLVNVIRIEFQNTGTNTGSTVTLPLNNINDMVNGVLSTNQKLVVASTKPFNVNIKSSAADFSYTGSYTNNNSMPVSNVLDVRVNQNYTGGSIGSGYNSYNAITATAQNIINGGDNGVNKNFRIKYRATPGLQYAAGTYLTNVIFTATQQ